MDYGRIEWNCGIKSFNYGYFYVLMKMVDYSLVKVIPKDLVSAFFDKNFKYFFKFLKLRYMFFQSNIVDLNIKASKSRLRC